MSIVLRNVENNVFARTSLIDIPRANGAKRRVRVLIPHGYLHPGKGKHSEV